MLRRALPILLVLSACTPTMDDLRQNQGHAVIQLRGAPRDAADCVADQLDRTPLLAPLPDVFPPQVRRRGEAATVFLQLDSLPIYVIDIAPTATGSEAKLYGGLREGVVAAVSKCS